MTRKRKVASAFGTGVVALALLVVASAPHIGQKSAPLPIVRPVSAITQEHRVLPTLKPPPTPVSKESPNVEPDSTTPAEIAFELQKPSDRPAISTSKESPRDKPTPEPSPSQNTATVAATEPQMGDTRIVDGQKQVYFLGCGWIEDNDEPNIGIVVDGDGDINKMVGSMGGGEVGRSCGDINKMVGTMD